MKRTIVLTVCSLMVAGIAWASVGVDNAGTPIGAASDINCSTGLTCTVTNNNANVAFANPLLDVSLYTASAGTGGSKTLRISADGTIYAF